jgi:glutaconate CoA-transferase subunit A
MDTRPDKVMGLTSAIETYVANGCHISIGGFTLNRNPMAAIYEIIRQGIKGLHLYAHSNGQGMDELVGSGCVDKIEIAYAGTGRFAPTCYRFRKAVEKKVIHVEDYSNYQMTLRFMAGAMGVPFLPTLSSIGSDILKRWGFSRATREKDPRMPRDKMTVIENPFGSWGGTERVVLLPSIVPDVTIIHAQKADRQGTVRIRGLTFADVEQAKAATHLIVTCEEIVESGELRRDSDMNQIPFFHTDAVVHIPMGAYPTACFGHYDYDPVYLNEYARVAKDDELYAAYVESIRSIPDHAALLDRVGNARLEKIKADPERGYAPNLDRR